ncbi:alpha/beta hydrolase [Virgibacillus sp. YIM 98842]|jgi:alpha-beta hydrolase superfamily lysophospholipase|uniref:alpha/beta hydrolase n=1 Tax=Virgibacillus sp. YIM 98842 TaxID=2663533 RepID=UPI0013DC7CBF|nr:alpha/beta hydrolase [Virgibacillus sp. YIM 98842]
MEKSFWITMDDGAEVYVKKWDTANKMPFAVVQIAHGMIEHIERYNDFANFLVKQGIVVYGNDHRGHGQTGEKQGLMGYFADKNGFQRTAEDLHVITKEIQSDYPNIPIFLFGHSMGSFLARHYVQKYGEDIKGAILSGTGYTPNWKLFLAGEIARKLPPKEESKLMNFLVFANYNKKIKGNKTAFDWLSQDEKTVGDYIEDRHTGFIPTALFFYDLMTGIKLIQSGKLNRQIPNDLPLLFVSGEQDPVGDYTKGVWRAAGLYDDAGLSGITTMLFPGKRHELINEINHLEVYEAIYKWITMHTE